MTNPKIRDGQAAVRMLRKRLEATQNGVDHVVVGQALAAIESGLLAAAEEVAAQPAPVVPVELPPTLGDLELDVIRTVIEYRRTRNRLLGFNASARTQARELMVPQAAFDAAVEKLALAREAEQARKLGAA